MLKHIVTSIVHSLNCLCKGNDCTIDDSALDIGCHGYLFNVSENEQVINNYGDDDVGYPIDDYLDGLLNN